MSINLKDLDYKQFIGIYNEKFENKFNNFIGSVDKNATDEQIINGLNKIYGETLKESATETASHINQQLQSGSTSSSDSKKLKQESDLWSSIGSGVIGDVITDSVEEANHIAGKSIKVFGAALAASDIVNDIRNGNNDLALRKGISSTAGLVGGTIAGALVTPFTGPFVGLVAGGIVGEVSSYVAEEIYDYFNDNGQSVPQNYPPQYFSDFVLEEILSDDADAIDITLDDIIAEKFTQASTINYGDPLVVDLDGDGIETHGADGSVLFDHDADGRATGTGWTTADDGLLVRDIDGSGTIDTGRELFGDNTLKADGTKARDGFDALSDLDSNADGVFDSSDTAFDEVQVWQDKDQDGITDAGELTSLADAGIDSIDLNAKTVNQSVAGGILRKTSSATKADGTTATVGAMDFAENKFYSKFEEVLQSSQDLQNSINVAGQGALRSLHESASQSPALNDLLKDLYSGNTAITDAAAHEVLLEWAKTSVNFTTSLELLDGFTLEDGTQINVGLSDRVRNVIEKTAILEALNGERLLDYQIRDHGGSWGVYVRSGSEVFDFSNGGARVTKGGTVTLNDWDFHRLADNGRTTAINQGYASALSSIKESVETSFIVNEIQPFLLENLSFEFTSTPLSTSDDAGEVALNFDGINEFKLVA